MKGAIYVDALRLPDTSVAHCYSLDPSGPALVDGGGLSVYSLCCVVLYVDPCFSEGVFSSF